MTNPGYQMNIGQNHWTALGWRSGRRSARPFWSAIMAAAATLASAAFAMAQSPSLTLDAPHSGDVLYVGEKVTIDWRAEKTTAVRIDYSTDLGATWMSVLPDNGTIPARRGSFDWTIPNTPSESVRVRVTDAERSGIIAIATPLVIRRAAVTILSPNGGEAYKPGAPITVTWSESNTAALRLEYSPDNGLTWVTIAELIAPELGEYTFTPPPGVTKLAHLRIVDMARQNVHDLSDRPFEIVPMSVAGVGSDRAEMSAGALLGAFPNPVAERTELRWLQSSSADVALHLYEPTGRLVASHDLGWREKGEQRSELRVGGLPAGVYIYELTLGERVLRSRVMVVR